MSDPQVVAPPGTPLTDREREILAVIWNTGSIPAAAAELHLSYHTVRGHAQNARSRLRARTTLEAIRKAGLLVQSTGS